MRVGVSRVGFMPLLCLGFPSRNFRIQNHVSQREWHEAKLTDSFRYLSFYGLTPIQFVSDKIVGSSFTFYFKPIKLGKAKIICKYLCQNECLIKIIGGTNNFTALIQLPYTPSLSTDRIIMLLHEGYSGFYEVTIFPFIRGLQQDSVADLPLRILMGNPNDIFLRENTCPFKPNYTDNLLLPNPFFLPRGGIRPI